MIVHHTLHPVSVCSMSSLQCGCIPYTYIILSALAWGFGDPHITTLDGYQYTFNGWGEYVLVKVENQFELQGRTSPVNNSNATMFSAFAFGVTEAIVEVEYI